MTKNLNIANNQVNVIHHCVPINQICKNANPNNSMKQKDFHAQL